MKYGYLCSLRYVLVTAFFASMGVLPCQALVIYNKVNDSTDITTDPNNGSPWEAVGRVSDNGNTRGSAVYLGNRYLLTANHISPSDSRTVQFTPGGTNFNIEAGSQKQVASGLDLKVFRITSDPGIAGAELFDGTNELDKETTVVGWGKGRADSSAPGDTTQDWGDQSTTDKRWGTNVITNSSVTLDYSSYNYEGIQYTLGDNQGDTEAGMATWDSGGAMFILNNDTWYLGGINTIVSTDETSTFDSLGRNESGDINAGPRISTYKADIEAAVPEPSAAALALGLGALTTVATFRGHPRRSRR